MNVLVEVRDSWTGYLVPVRDGPGALSDVESSWDVAAAAVAAAVAVIWNFRSTYDPVKNNNSREFSLTYDPVKNNNPKEFFPAQFPVKNSNPK